MMTGNVMKEHHTQLAVVAIIPYCQCVDELDEGEGGGSWSRIEIGGRCQPVVLLDACRCTELPGASDEDAQSP